MNKRGVIAILLILFVIGFFLYFWRPFSESQRKDFYINEHKLFGEFYLYRNEIYASVPSNGNYHMPQVDVASFHAISDEYSDGHIGVDKNNVYCGNRIVPKMNPKTIKQLGNNYYTDGKITYYCGRITKRNADLPWYKELPQMIGNMFGAKKPQTWVYPMKALPDSDTPYYPLLNNSIITNGKQVYHSGKLMPKANPQKLHKIKSYHSHSGNKWRESDEYFGDGKNVYFQHQLLPLPDDENLYIIDSKFTARDVYLIAPHNGMVYANTIPFDTGEHPNTIPFDEENAPYTLMSEADTHVNHTLWLSENGVFFYDGLVDKDIKRADENPFLNKDFKEITPLVFSNGKETLFVDAYEVWEKRRHSGKVLITMNTVIYSLDDLPKEPWQEQKKARFYAVWKKGDEYYYFDNWGESQQIPHPVYKIIDSVALEILLGEEELRRDDINKLIDEEKMIVPPKTEIINAESVFNFSLSRWIDNYRGWLIIIGVIYILRKIFKRTRGSRKNKIEYQ